MKILEFGDKSKRKIILIHGFQSPWQVWEKYIEYFKNDFHIIVPVMSGHNQEKVEEFVSFEDDAKQIEDFVISNYGKDVFAADPLPNTMFSVHMYEYAGGNSADVKSHIDDITGKGLCMIVGEFGIKHTDGAVAYQTILDYCTQTNTGYLGWSWKGNSGGVEYLDMVNDWEGTSLTEQGKAIIEGQNGIRATSKICSVFGSSNKI